MAKFAPETTIYLCDQTGIDQYNKPYYESNTAMVSWLMGKVKVSFSNYSYQRADERQYCTINYDYYNALTCDIIMWRNAGHSQKWIIANITEIEWVNPNTTRIYFEVDAWCTFCGEAQLQPCFVEREHVENDWTGTMPNWANNGVPESFSAKPERVVSESLDLRNMDPTIMIVYARRSSPTITGTMDDRIYSGLIENPFSNANQANDFLTSLAEEDWSNLSDVVGVYTVPAYIASSSLSTIDFPTPAWEAPACSGKYNNSKIYSSQFCIMQIESPCGQDYSYKPELIGVAAMATIYKKGSFAAGSGGAKAYLVDYAGADMNNNPNLAATITQLPQGQVIGTNYANSMGAQLQAAAVNSAVDVFTGIARGALGGFVSGGGTAAGAAIGAATGIIGNMGELAQKSYEAQKGVAGVSGHAGGAANFAASVMNFRFVPRWYTPKEPVMQSIDAYFDRYGYRVDRLKRPSTSRPKWNYIKCSEAHVAGSMPAVYREKIENMLNTGVTLWKTDNVEIGDFSNPETNKE